MLVDDLWIVVCFLGIELKIKFYIVMVGNDLVDVEIKIVNIEKEIIIFVN